MRILLRCLAGTGLVALCLAAVGALAGGPAAALSVLFGTGLVVLFFGISLIIGHALGRTNPSGALGLFVVTYAIKVVGFAVVLFFFGAPAWLERTWFFSAAVVAVVVWQVVEVIVFARQRRLLFDEPAVNP